MANFFDQFDSPAGAPPPPASGNFFNQFDVTPASQGQPARITVRPPPPPGSAEALKDASFAEKALAPITGLPATYTGMVRHGLQAASEGTQQAGEALAGPISTPETSALERAIQGIQEGKDIDYAVQQAQQPDIPTRERSLGPIPVSDRLKAVSNILGGFGKTVAGAGEYLTAPIFAPIRSIVAQPVENVTGGYIPKEWTEFAAGLALPIPKNIPGVARAPEEFIPTRPATPTEGMLRAQASRQYQSPEVTGTMLPPTAATRLSDQIMTDLARGRANDVTAPTVYSLVGRIEQPPAGAAGFSVNNIETLRQQLGEIGPIKDGTGRVINKPELRAAQIARSRIDEFLRQNAPEAAATLEQARGNISAAEGAATINRKEFRAELRAAAANSGMNISNTMRQRIADILLDPAQRRGYSRAELAMMDRIVRGTTTENLLRTGSNILGGGGGAHAFYSGVLTGGAAPAVGFALKSLSNRMTANNIQRLNDMIRADSPLGRQLQTPLSDWGAAQEAFAAAPTARNRARLTIASRNLSNNLSDAGVKITPDRLIGGPSLAPASENGEQ